MITVNRLTKIYKGNITALRGIDLELSGSGMFGLLGVNGAGKTTLMRILAGLISPTSGAVHVFGHDLKSERGKQATKALLGYLPQELGLYPNLSGREFLDYLGILKGIENKRERAQQVDEALEKVRLSDTANRQIKTYSGGMKRRVGIAQALLGKPQLLIVDEPTVGLDPEERVRLRNLFAEMSRTCAVILSTHIVEDISQSCNDVAVLDQGRVLFRGAPRDLISAARGKVWTILSADGKRPNDGLEVVSTLQLQDGIQYRVLGEWNAQYPIPMQPAEPSLEDGYMWLMKQSRLAPQSLSLPERASL
jgi:ABC-2 type transport system ATP-binding protein